MGQTQVYTTAIQAAPSNAKNFSPLYPAAGQNALADQLKIMAQLVADGFSTRIYVCQLGSFNLLSNQVPTTGCLARRPTRWCTAPTHAARQRQATRQRGHAG
ncbi:MAG: hypothetical protein ACRYF0_04645 [Janthinobacterium lividum]